MLLRINLYYTWVQLLHLCLPQVPLTRNPDPRTKFGLRSNKHLAPLGGIFWGSHISHISSLTWNQDICHLYQSVNKANGKSERCRDQGWKKIHNFRLWEGEITNPLKTPAHQVQDYIGERGTFALIKRGQKWNSPKLGLFHKCFIA